MKTIIKITLLLVIMAFAVYSFGQDSSDNKGAIDHARPDVISTPIYGVSALALKLDGTTIASHTNTSATTEAGVIDVEASLSIPEQDVRIVNNGTEFPLTVSDSNATGKVILVSGENYITLMIYTDGFRYGRSISLLITSKIVISALRFELMWSGKADLDLHVDDGTHDNHCYYSNKTVNKNLWDMKLDVDNTVKKGPENIRIYSIRPNSKIRCYVNYYRGSIIQKVTVRRYQYGHLTGVYTHTFSPTDVKPIDGYNNLSWIVMENSW